MGGQQFSDNDELIDLRGMNRVLELDIERGLVRAEAGIMWPDLIRSILEIQLRLEPHCSPKWGIAQKQTGADAFTMGGALSANIHGRGLLMGPIVNDVESFTIIDASGNPITCSRSANQDFFFVGDRRIWSLRRDRRCNASISATAYLASCCADHRYR